MGEDPVLPDIPGPRLRVIWKYSIPAQWGAETIQVREHAEFLSLQMQYGRIAMWYLVDPEAPLLPYRYQVVGTGQSLSMDPATAWFHRGTVQDGAFIWHVFETVGV